MTPEDFLRSLTPGKSTYIKMSAKVFVCTSVGMWRANGNPNPFTDLDKILHAHPTCPRKV